MALEVITPGPAWLELVVLQGSPAARWYLRDQATVTIGAGKGADLPIEDAFVSQTHGRFVRRAGRWCYLDVGSKNGSWLYRDGQVSRLIPGEPGVELFAGDALRLGGTLIGVREAGTTPELRDAATPEISASRPLGGQSGKQDVIGTVRAIAEEPFARLDPDTASAEAVLDATVECALASIPGARRAVAVELDHSARPIRHAAVSPRGPASPVLGLGAQMLQRIAGGNQVVLIRDDRPPASGTDDGAPRLTPGRGTASDPDANGRTCVVAPLQIAGGARGLLLVERAGGAVVLDSDFDTMSRISSRAALALSSVAVRELRAREIDAHNETAMAAHDFGNGLTAILGALGYLAETELTKPQESAVSDALASARWLVDLNRTFLDLLQLEDGKLLPTIRRMVVLTEVTRCLALVRRIYDAQRVRLVNDVPPGIAVYADPELFRRILSNLLGNAVRHAPEASTVRVTARRLGEQVEVAVHDQGPGIAPEVQDQLFEQQVRGPRPGLMGIGLLFCRLAVERMGGRIGVESSPGAGSTFHLTLGLAEPEEPLDEDDGT